MLFRCQPGYELHLERELRPLGLVMADNGGGWLQTNPPLHTPHSTSGTPHSALRTPQSAFDNLCFAHSILPAAQTITGETVNALAARVADYFLESARTERFDAPWPLIFDTSAGHDGLGRRAAAVENALFELLRKRMSRVAKLASPTLPLQNTRCHPFPRRGLFVFFTDYHNAFISRDLIHGGQRRMADDPLAPSRSYLKVEEAYGILGCEPAPGETVVDPGAAPGGWSYSAAKRGARVLAVDNGPLKAGALDNSLITHLHQDAFHYDPTAARSARIKNGKCIMNNGQAIETIGTSSLPVGAEAPHSTLSVIHSTLGGGEAAVDWLFCDLVEDPHHVLDNIVLPWLERRWCRRYIVNLKFGRVDPVALLQEARAQIPSAKIRHLYHDREEFTLVGEI